MSMEIDKLSLEIESDASGASGEIDKLASSLVNLKSSLTGAEKLRNFSTALKNFNDVLGSGKVNANLKNISTGINYLTESFSKLNDFKTDATGLLNSLNNIKSIENGVKNVDYAEFETKINQLVNAFKPLDKLKTPNLNKYINQIKKADELNGIDFGGFKNNVGELASALMPLQALGNTNLGSFLNQIRKLPKISSGLNKVSFSVFTKQIQGLSVALKPLEQIGKTNLGSFFTQLNKLPAMQEKLDTVVFTKFAVQMRQLASAIKPLEGISIKLGRAFSNLPWHIKKASSQLDKYSSSANKASKSSGTLMSSLGKSVASFRTMTFIIQGTVGAFASVFEESSSYIENLNLFNVAMGETTQSAMNFAQKVQDAMGIDMGDWMGYQGKMNNLLTGFDVGAEKAQIMSQNLTQLAYDYSSLMNVNVSESFDKINSAMSGQIKGLKDYGNNVSVAMVKQTGLKYGLDGAVSSWDQNTQATMRYITIMNNASKVDVFNDMARTIATPANAVRILTQQFTMLKRAIGNIASVFISKLVPYVQIAVQWLTALANTIANFFGFELPKIDYSGIAGGGGALDDMEDSANSAGDAVGGTADKIKELKKQMMGFDELNIINKPDDSDSGGGGGSGGGAGGGSIGDIELPQYDFLKGLENQTNEMMDRLAKKMAEMFKPVTNSWNKYGKGVLDSIEYEWTEIGNLIESIGTSFGEVWQNGTGEETIDHVFSIITNINVTVGNLAKQFRTAWDEAGTGTQIVQNLWDSFNNLLGLVEDITRDLVDFSNSLNFKPIIKSAVDFTDSLRDLSNVVSKILYGAYKDVLEPLAKWTIEKAVPSLINSLAKSIKGLSKILDALRPAINILEKITTWLLKMAGNTILKAIDLLASAIDGLGGLFKKFPALMGGVTTAVSTFMLAWKIDQLVTTNTKIGAITASLKLIPTAVGAIKSVGFVQAMSDWAGASFGANNAISSLLGFGSKLNSIDGPLKAITMGFGSLATKAESAFGVSNLLSTSLTFLASNPLVAVVAGVAALSIAFIALTGDSNNLTREQERLIEESKELASESKKLAKAQRELNKAGEESAKQANDSSEKVMLWKNKLSELVDENGRVTGSTQLAEEYVKKINTALGTNITITDGVIQNYKNEVKAIDNTVEAMKRKALMQAYEEEYINAVKEEDTVKQNLTITQNNYNTAYGAWVQKMAEYGATVEDINGKTQTYYDALSQVNLKNNDLNITLAGTEEALKEAEGAFVTNAEAQNNYTASAQAMDGTVASVTASICEQYGILSKDGYYTYASLANGLNDLGDKCDENGERWKLLSETEQKASKEARTQLLNDLVLKASASGKTYDQMISTAEKKGAKLTDTDKKHLRDQYNALKQADEERLAELERTYNLTESKKIISNSKLKKEDIGTLKELTDQWTKSGNEQGLGLIKNLADQIHKDKGKVTDKSKNILEDIEKQTKDSKPEVNINVKSPSQKRLDEIKSTIEGVKPSVTLDLKANKTGIEINGQKFKIDMYASGGFPDMGQMFVAREAGPELVGRIGKKTAVANNDQIVSAVSGGVYNAMRSAMAGMSGGGKIEVHTTVEMNGKEVGKAVFEEHNGIVKQTGKSPLLI